MSTVTPDAYVGSSAGDIKQRSSMHNKSLKKIRTTAVGELEIHFKYDVFAEILSVVLLRARGVANHSSDCQVRVCLLSEGKFKRKSKKIKSGPVMTFNETIAEYRMGAMGIRDQVLRAQVVSSDGSVLGEAYAPVKRSMVAEDGSTDWYKLQPVASSGNQKFLAKIRNNGGVSSGESILPLLSWLEEQNGAIMKKKAGLNDVSKRLKRYQLLDMSRATWTGKGFHAVWELFTSEICHFLGLSLLTDVFQELMLRMRQVAVSDARISGLLTQVDTVKLFGNTEGLKNVSFKFLCALEEAIVDLESNTFYKQKGKSDDQCQRVLDAFLNIKDEFLVQEFEYRVKVGKSRDYMKELVEKNDKHFMAFIAWCEDDERCDRLSFVDLLSRPLQRLTRYPLLLRAVRKHGGISNKLRGVYKKEILQLEKDVKKLNDNVRVHEGLNQLERLEATIHWQSPLENCPEVYMPEAYREELSEPAIISLGSTCHVRDEMPFVPRQLNLKGELDLIGENGKVVQAFTGYVVGEVLVLTKRVDKSLKRSSAIQREEIYERPYHIRDLEAVPVPLGDPHADNTFMLLFNDGFGSTYKFMTLRCTSSLQKNVWLDHLHASTHETTNSPKPRERKGSLLSNLAFSVGSNTSNISELIESLPRVAEEPEAPAPSKLNPSVFIQETEVVPSSPSTLSCNASSTDDVFFSGSESDSASVVGQPGGLAPTSRNSSLSLTSLGQFMENYGLDAKDNQEDPLDEFWEETLDAVTPLTSPTPSMTSRDTSISGYPFERCDTLASRTSHTSQTSQTSQISQVSKNSRLSRSSETSEESKVSFRSITVSEECGKVSEEKILTMHEEEERAIKSKTPTECIEEQLSNLVHELGHRHKKRSGSLGEGSPSLSPPPSRGRRRAASSPVKPQNISAPPAKLVVQESTEQKTPPPLRFTTPEKVGNFSFKRRQSPAPDTNMRRSASVSPTRRSPNRRRAASDGTAALMVAPPPNLFNFQPAKEAPAKSATTSFKRRNRQRAVSVGAARATPVAFAPNRRYEGKSPPPMQPLPLNNATFV